MESYQLVSAKKPAELQAKCNILAAEGFVPIGSIGRTQYEFFQAMFRENTKEKAQTRKPRQTKKEPPESEDKN